MFHFRVSCLIFALMTTWPLSTARSADWPMWRNDRLRSGTSDAELPSRLQLQWTRKLGTPMLAWPNEPRLHFDASYQPIVLGSRMFVGSMIDGSMTALDTKSGDELWRFYTNGPIRLAPVALGDNVYFGSDDGWLYCVDASNGTLLWKVSGAPEERGTHRHLGNGRLVSFWPVRGGPVIADGVIYFGAGIWPTLGVFVHAIDAASGELIWTNDNSHAIENVRVDHNYMQESGISPQGHMLVRGDLLIVPNGRSMPARFERKTGELQYFVQGYRNGDSRVTVSGDIALVGRTGLVSLRDGREIGSRWASAGKDAPEGFSTAKADLFEGPLFPYKFLLGCDFRSAVENGIAYGVENGTLYAYDLNEAQTSLEDMDFHGNALKPLRWQSPLLWKLATSSVSEKKGTQTLIKAGSRLYAHSGTRLFAVQLENETSKAGEVVWETELPAEPTSMLAADDRLFVVLKDGSIHCFGEQVVDPKVHQIDQTDVRSPTDGWTELAASILKASEGNDGYAVVVGLEKGRLVEELLTQSQYHVIAIDDDATTINRLRRRYGSDSQFRSRFQAIVEDPASASLPPYLANLIASEKPEMLQLDAESQLQKFYQVLRPYGGSLCLSLNDSRSEAIRTRMPPQRFAGIEAQQANGLLTIRRTGPLPGSAIWSHETGDAARSFFSKDKLVQAPLAVLWYGDGRNHGFHKRKDYGHGLKPQVAGGRLIALQVATNTLKAVDAYTGRMLWSRKVGGSARYVSMSDGVYVADERKCLVLDPSSGELRHQFVIDLDRPAETPISVSDIRVDQDVILIAMRFNKENGISKGRWNSRLLIALDRASGKKLWSRLADLRYNTAAIAMSDGRVFCIDSHSPEVIGIMHRRGEAVDDLPSTILAIDSRTGREVWKVVRHDPPATLASLHFMGLRTQDDWLAYSTAHDILLAGRGNHTVALDGKTGKEVWERPERGQQPLILGSESFINQTGRTYQITTGEPISSTALFQRGGCNYAVGGENLIFLRSNCATYVDIESGQQYAIRNLRSGCSNSLIAADGLLNAPCFSMGCVCNYPIQTSFAMFHMPESAAWHGVETVKQEVPRQ